MTRLISALSLFLSLFLQPAAAFAQSAAPIADGGILVFGATGQLGSDIVQVLVKAGKPVTVFNRPNADMKRLAGLNVTTVQGDVLNEADVTRAFKAAKFKVAIDALGRGTSGPEFYDISQKYISAAAKATGVEQVILHSSVGAGKSRAIYPEANWERMKGTLLAKEAGENHLINSGVPYTIIRNAVLFPYGTAATGKAQLYEGETKFGGVTRADLATLTLGCIDNKECLNKIYHAVDDSLPPRR